jgi:hypothetical protein
LSKLFVRSENRIQTTQADSPRHNIIQHDSSSFAQESERGKRISRREAGGPARLGRSRSYPRVASAGRVQWSAFSASLPNCEAEGIGGEFQGNARMDASRIRFPAGLAGESSEFSSSCGSTPFEPPPQRADPRAEPTNPIVRSSVMVVALHRPVNRPVNCIDGNGSRPYPIGCVTKPSASTLSAPVPRSPLMMQYWRYCYVVCCAEHSTAPRPLRLRDMVSLRAPTYPSRSNTFEFL